VATHCTIRTTQCGPHLRAWGVETSADAEKWQEGLRIVAQPHVRRSRGRTGEAHQARADRTQSPG
jgi:hypothetical protein